MKKFLFILIIITISNKAFANKTEVTTNFGGRVSIETESLNKYKNQINKYLNDLTICKTNIINYDNPIYNTKGFYNIRGLNRFNACIVEYNVNNIIKYECPLTKKQIEEIVFSKKEDLLKNNNLETMNKTETNYFAKSENCRVTILKNATTTTNVDEVIKNNPNLDLILKTFGL